MFIVIVYALSIISCAVHAVQESALFKKDLRLINVPVSGIYVAPTETSSYDSQKVYGHWVEVINSVNQQWVEVKSDDEVTGYMKVADLIPDNTVWRVSEDLQRVCVLTGCVYPTASVTKQTIIRLPYNALIKILEKSDDGKWTSVMLVDGTTGWIMTGDIEPLNPLSYDQIEKRLNLFVGLPYIWGGASSVGYDCSGFSQTIARQMGYPMKRNSGSQAKDPELIPVAYDDIQPGDFVYFGKDRVSHVALCVGKNQIIHSAVLGNEPRLVITSMDHPQLIFNCARRLPSLEYKAIIAPINEQIFERMKKSWQDHNPVPLKDLRLITLNYWGFDHCIHTGELIVHAEVAQEVVDIFKEMFEAHYPIERMKLIDEYEAKDGFSCADNNSSAFCSRLLTNSNDKWSLHSFGVAIDINTRLNPYHKGDYIGPVNGEPFLNRSLRCKGLIRKNDVCCTAFLKRGWKWAGDWQEPYGYVDYQHFYKEDNLSPHLIALAKKYTPQLS